MKKEKLNRKIYLTRCSRIIFAEELNKKHKFYQILITYYTVAIIAFSILEMTTSFSNSSYILIMSITLSFFTVAVQSQNHKERYLALKQHYIKLDDLSQKLEDDGINKEAVEEIRKKYIEMLDQVENHNEIHLFKHLIKDVNELENKTKSEIGKIKRKIFFYDSKVLLIKSFFVVIPFLIPFIDCVVRSPFFSTLLGLV